jgi:hypothetical protein
MVRDRRGLSRIARYDVARICKLALLQIRSPLPPDNLTGATQTLPVLGRTKP